MTKLEKKTGGTKRRVKRSAPKKVAKLPSRKEGDSVNLQARCKLCGLIKRQKDLWIELHSKVLEEGLGKAAVCNWLNQRMDILNANLKAGEQRYPTFNNVNFTNHFAKHLSDITKVKAVLVKSLKQSTTHNSGYTIGDKLIAEASQESDENALTYKEFPFIVENFEQQVVAELKQSSSLTQGGRFRTREAVERMKLLQAVLDVKQGLAKVHRSSHVGGEAIRSATKLLGLGVMQTTKEIGQEVKSNLETHFPTGSFPDEIYDLIEQRMFVYLKAYLPEVLDTIAKMYGIK